MENQASSSLFEMEIDNYAQNHLSSISRWGKFISVTGFIFLGLILLLMVFVGQRFIVAFSELMPGGDLGGEGISPSEFNTVLWLLVAGVIIYWLLFVAWCYFLYRASILFKKGLITRNVVDISSGFSSLRGFFVCSIVISALSILTVLYTMLNF